MLFMADPVKRQYRSPARTAAAAATRARIRQAAQELFVRQGFVSTTMRQVAAAAGVAERTLYGAYPSKAALFGHALGVATVGDEQPVRVADRPEIVAAREAADPRTAIALLVAYSADLLERAGELIMVSVEAAGADPDMQAAADVGARATHQVMLAFTGALHGRGALRSDLDPIAAADILTVLCSPHVHQIFRRHRGWSSERYRVWVEQAAARDLLG